MISRSSDPAAPFEMAIEAAPSGIVVARADGAIVLVNREVERQFGYTRQELVGRSVELLLPDAMRKERAPYRPTGVMGRTLSAHRKDGSEFQIQLELTRIQADGDPLMLASVRDAAPRQPAGDGDRGINHGISVARLVAELSARFINTAPEGLTAEIRQALGCVCAVFGFDDGVFYEADAPADLVEAVRWSEDRPADLPVSRLTRAHLPWTVERLQAGEPAVFASLTDISSESERAAYERSGVRSAVTLPLLTGSRLSGAVAFHTTVSTGVIESAALQQFVLVTSLFTQVLARRQSTRALTQAMTDLKRLQLELQVDNVQLQHEISARLGLGQIVGQSAAIRGTLERVRQVAATDATVLLLGETGTGKELLATRIHELSPRRDRAMVRVNCAAIPATLIESELFGRERGAFTGALARQLGRFELAHGSTIFLDEIGDLPHDTQVKLLRVLEERQIERLGSPHAIHVDVRIIAATHRNLDRRMAEGRFREDLYYRLNVFPIHVPPVRERTEDIPPLVWRFVEEFSKTLGKRVDSIPAESLKALQHYSWPGNLRELRNVVERAMITLTGNTLVVAPPQASIASAQRSPKLIDIEREHIRSVLEGVGWRVRGSNGAADRLGLKPTTLETRMARLGLKRPALR